MKQGFIYSSIVVFALSFATSESVAAFKVPRSVFQMSEIEEAQAEAKEKGKALAFVYTDPGSS